MKSLQPEIWRAKRIPVIKPWRMGKNDNNRKRTLEGSVSNVSVKLFKVMSNEDQFQWLLPEEMTEYVNGHFQRFLPEKGVHDSTLM